MLDQLPELEVASPTPPFGRPIALGRGATAAAYQPLLLPSATRENTRDRLTSRALALSDGLALSVAVAVGTLAGPPPAPAAMLCFVLLTLAGLHVHGAYRRDRMVLHAATIDELPRLAQAVTLGAAVALLSAGALPGPTLPRPAALAAWLTALAVLPALRTVARRLVRGNTEERVLIVGSGSIAELVAQKIAGHPEYGLTLVGCLDADDVGVRPTAVQRVGALRDIEDVVREHRVDRVVIAFSAQPHEELLEAVRRCKRLGVKIGVVPRLFEVIGSQVEVHDVEGLTILGLGGPNRTRGAVALKRAVDVGCAGLALLFLAPFLAAVALAVKLTSKGPVLFRQVRVGCGQQPFEMFKFRTMVEDAEALKGSLAHLNEMADGTMFKIAADPRVTPVGRFLRAASLDELPQLVNVLLGQMSIVGPRPLVPNEDIAILGWHRARLDITPGLTGPWQVMGRNAIPLHEMVKLDYLYVAEWSLWNDVKLMLRTLPLVVRRAGS